MEIGELEMSGVKTANDGVFGWHRPMARPGGLAFRAIAMITDWQTAGYCLLVTYSLVIKMCVGCTVNLLLPQYVEQKRIDQQANFTS